MLLQTHTCVLHNTLLCIIQCILVSIYTDCTCSFVHQHATDEKFNFERLQRDGVIENQKLIQLVVIVMSCWETVPTISVTTAFAECVALCGIRHIPPLSCTMGRREGRGGGEGGSERDGKPGGEKI